MTHDTPHTLAAVLAAALLAALLLLIIYHVAAPAAGGPPLAAALAESGWTLYTRPGCRYCTRQLALLGPRGYPRHVVCGRPGAPCAHVAAVPRWEGPGAAVRVGLQDRAQLRRMARRRKNRR